MRSRTAGPVAHGGGGHARRPPAGGAPGRSRLQGKLAAGWAALKASYAGLSAARLTESGVTGDWSVKDILAHVTTWEREALRHLPVIAVGGRPPRYVRYGGIDAFNAKMTRESRDLALGTVLRRLDDTHRRLVRFVDRAPIAPGAREARFRRRLRLDTYAHYPEHVAAIRAWRQRVGE